MSRVYESFYLDHGQDSGVVEHLRPIMCEICRREYGSYGECERCMKNRIHNAEWLSTHTFVLDDQLRGYHSARHSQIKGLPLRMPHEKPYQYYGVEIEVEFDHDIWSSCDDEYYDDEYDLAEYERKTLEDFSAITNGLFVYERDASLSNGVEMISRPMSYAYWTSKENVERLRKGMEYLKTRGAMTIQPASNGLHIHTSKRFYAINTDDHGAERFKEFDWFFQTFQAEVETVGGRKYTPYCASRKDKISQNILADLRRQSGLEDVKISGVLRKGTEVARGDHYSAINLGSETIETRVFKSTIDYTEILSYIELVRNVAHATREGMEGRTFNDILHTKPNLYLDKHLAKCGLAGRKEKKVFDFDKMDSGLIAVEITADGNK